MSVSKKTPLPVILLANHLLDGDVVFFTGQDWSLDPRQAKVAYDEASAHLLDIEGKAAFARQEVVDAYLVDVQISSDGLPIPNHFRERFKIKGPSHRIDLGKQADFDVR